jgi:hypothetical protein
MKIIFFLLLLIPFTYSQSISDERINKIINLLITNSPDISDYINADELKITERFGIEYEGIKNKFLIANNIPEDFSDDLLNRKIKYETLVENLEDNFSSLIITIPSLKFKREYFLKDSFLVSSAFYHSRNWKVIASDHFKFFVSNETLFNDYSINLLENFINKMSEFLSFTDEERNQLKEKKIFYFLCKDEEEIQKVTGFATRGIFILAQDYVITTYNIHYHELLHFLINYKLRKLPLYTHPFLQEGFAVAFGGRGGLDAHTISEMGVFLIKSGFANYKELLSKLDFQKTDASISYPISGLHTEFLLKNIGIDNYLKLYRKYSGSSEKVLSEKINEKDLLSEDKWNLFIDSLSSQNPVVIKTELSVSDYKLITKQNDFEVYEDEKEYIFKIKDTLLITTSIIVPNYKSKIFSQHFPNRKYNSEKYLIIANQNEISVYNLFSNNLIGKYVASFSIPPNTIPFKDGFYEFLIKKDLFDEQLNQDVFQNVDDI